MNIKITELTNSRDSVNKWMERYGVRFGVYKNGVFNEQLFPFDPVPRVISNDDWSYLEQGLKQRVQALNKFLWDVYHEKKIIKDGILWDVYHEKKIIKDGIVPEEFVYSSKGYMPECEQINPTGGVYAHIAGIDLVEGKDGQWYVLEDNLRIPSGASYPMIARQITRRVAPSTFASHTIAENRGYADLLHGMMDEMNDGRGISVILTPGRYNSAYFEHSYLAEKTGATLAYPGDLFVEDNKVYYSGIYKDRIRVGCIYRRVSDALTDAGATTAEKARQLCHRVYEMMAYEPETTTVETPAAEVFSRQCGVCQDYAHLMISFCRANGLPARYVNGFLEGTGQTHAWVEVFDGYSWQGYDPTHDRTLLQQGYVKIAHGRDSADCPVSRGMFCGQAVQQTQISVTLQEL